jgi:hypothetical protein
MLSNFLFYLNITYVLTESELTCRLKCFLKLNIKNLTNQKEYEKIIKSHID